MGDQDDPTSAGGCASRCPDRWDAVGKAGAAASVRGPGSPRKEGLYAGFPAIGGPGSDMTSARALSKSTSIPEGEAVRQGHRITVSGRDL